MTQTGSATVSATYTVLDIERVVRRVKADLIMIADSTGGWTLEKASHYAHDVELLAKAGYLDLHRRHVVQQRHRGESHALRCRYRRWRADPAAGPAGCFGRRSSRPVSAWILGYVDHLYRSRERGHSKGELKINWSPTNADTSHSALNSAGGRDYASNAYGMQRRDWAA